MIQDTTFEIGDTVKLYQKIKEGDKIRTQIFQGVVMGTRGRGENKSVTVRKLVGDVAIERVWPLKAPNLEKIDVVAKSKRKVRRAKLYYLRKTS
ncbi:MAG: 50S ribosomal protein L19 [Candidatus Levybacteria bacterium RIFCSPHIGHO2_02_FULL_42_12]|nr:MAG: 50S ribosomal protein L19 [Candidatus Levybacteria bacterium RIFCSPHIGHO2_01_FULL_42_15]OGH33810.1 MAG: 50S ribosomal protein L19 [Candidatus Levybacteria bacterium RIFCSPHIGHO2_02_FULL_42_12]OGH42963.1 MAG: 50S ribosomal protein L19 [Candidatus Levybacteria bacterium RIFCSPLOWO2_01_FULL_42_15]